MEVCHGSVQRAVDSHEIQPGKVRYQDFLDWVMHPTCPPAEGRKVILLLGPSASGKSTVSPKLAEQLGIPKITTHDLLRAAVALGSAVGRQVEGIMKRGGTVPDPLLMQLIHARVRLRDCSSGFVLDGFPETLNQAKLLDALLAESGDAVTAALFLDVSEEKLHARKMGRWTHKPSGRSYHITWAPPQSLGPGQVPCEANMRDDVTGEVLMAAEGCHPDEHKQELAHYCQEASSISTHYGSRGRRVLANGSPNDVWQAFQGVLSHFKTRQC
ncbi:adk [Symbiodinium natans]|uniref:Adk protein n=1 Tax=Symbiodinium natans TaxID=878477 RepID=A0A812PLY5_9DINO|nr:adk [Symbiodinium natans]